MRAVFHYYLGWYQGAIWSNLLASLIWAVPAYIAARLHLRKIHAKLDMLHRHIIDNAPKHLNNKSGV